MKRRAGQTVQRESVRRYQALNSFKRLSTAETSVTKCCGAYCLSPHKNDSFRSIEFMSLILLSHIFSFSVLRHMQTVTQYDYCVHRQPKEKHKIPLHT